MKNQELLVWKDGGVKINADMAFEMATAYGFPLELFGEEVNNLLPIGSEIRSFHIAKAYDKAHGTDFSSKVRMVFKELRK